MERAREIRRRPGARQQRAQLIDVGLKREIQLASRSGPTRPASVTAPTFEERARIWPTVIVSVPRSSASWMTLSATWIEYGSENEVNGVTRWSESAAATVTSLNVDPGS